MELLIVNGPNLNLLGTREPEIYGTQTFEAYLEGLQKRFAPVKLTHFQSNYEGDLISAIQQADVHYDGVILNAAAYTHTSVAIADAVKAIAIPVVEVHISNVFQREKFRHHSYLSPNVKGVIAGFGLKSYDLAIKSFIKNED